MRQPLGAVRRDLQPRDPPVTGSRDVNQSATNSKPSYSKRGHREAKLWSSHQPLLQGVLEKQMEPSRSAHYAPISKRQVYECSPTTGRIPLSSRYACLHYDRPLLGML